MACSAPWQSSLASSSHCRCTTGTTSGEAGWFGNSIRPALAEPPCCCSAWHRHWPGLLQVGLDLLIADRQVFACHKDRWDTIYYSELGSSKAILDAGYNIDSLMLRYQGIDWRDPSHWDCNAK